LEEQLELLKFIKILNKRKAIIIFGTLICLLAAIAATSYMSPEYEASVEMLVSQGQVTSGNQAPGESYQAILMSERLTKTFSKMITSRTLAERVIEKMELAMVPEDLQKKVDAKPEKDTQLMELTITDSNPVLAKNLANSYAEQFMKMTGEVIPSSALISVKVVESAVVPLDPIKPKPMVNAILGFLVGLTASVGFAFLLEMLDVTVKEKEDIEELTGISVLGRIPREEHPFLVGNDSSIAPEIYRSIRTNLQYLNFDQSIKTLIISSPNMGEGKTTISSNLAIVHAQAGYKVLLLECDLRRPMLSQVFNLSVGSGLSGILIGATKPESVIMGTGIVGLDVLPSGPTPPNPADLLSSERMDDLLESLSKKYDLVIIDCPPALAIADTAILASKSDAVLLVSSYGKTKKNEMVATKDTLNKVGARIIGFVINGAEMSGKYGYYPYKPYTEHQVADSRS